MKQAISEALSVLIIGLVALGLALGGATIAESAARLIDPSNITLSPCPTEDSDNCYWDADVHGNGEGRSFVTINGITYHED